MIDEGYIKFNSSWEKKPIIQDKEINVLNNWRKRLYDLKLLGLYDNGIGYGNISQRLDEKTFIITGTQTGNFAQLQTLHYSKVVQCNVDNNSLRCIGMTEASSESMSHFTVYQCFNEIEYVFHTHNFRLWKTHLNHLPTTHKNVPYGTPEMAYEIQRLFKETDVLEQGIFLTAGHEEGIFTFGKTADEAGERLLRWIV